MAMVFMKCDVAFCNRDVRGQLIINKQIMHLCQTHLDKHLAKIEKRNRRK